jgi:U3 small nucleolar RNA-associated protein 22
VDADSATRSALSALEVLNGKLKGLKGMPLIIDGVEALACALRYTSVFPPLPHPLSHGAGTDEDED